MFIPFESLKCNRDDISVLYGLEPIDRNDPTAASTAVELSLPTGFSYRAQACWDYYDGTAFLFEYKGKLVVTDESLWLTAAGDGTPGSPLGFPRWVCDSWEELEDALEENYSELVEDGVLEY